MASRVLLVAALAVAVQVLFVGALPAQEVANKQNKIFGLGGIGVAGGPLAGLERIWAVINEKILASSTSVSTAIADAVAEAQEAAQNATAAWENSLQEAISNIDALKEGLAECQAEGTSLSATVESLKTDVKECVAEAKGNATELLEQLGSLSTEVDALVASAQATVVECEEQVVPFVCVVQHLPQLMSEAGERLASAGKLQGKTAAKLSKLRRKASKCVQAAVDARTTEASATVETVKECVANLKDTASA